MNELISFQYLRSFASLPVLAPHGLQNLKIKPFGDYYISGSYGVDFVYILLPLTL